MICSNCLKSFFIIASLTIGFVSICSGRRARNIDLIEDFDIESSLPRFSQPIPNVTVTVGKDALLPCVVDNLHSYKLAWVFMDSQTILTIHETVITRNQRISLAHSDHRNWFLQIKATQPSDRGWYMCQINTDPMRSLMGYLEVVVPPQIIDKETSTDLVVKEGSNTTLHCKATGHPEPYVMWRREDNQEIQYNGVQVNVIDGEVFHILKVSRLNMGAYLCIASNGIPPSISKRIELKVQFPPMMTISHQLEGGFIGQEVSLECQTEAHPKSINYWTNSKGDMIISGDKYETILVDNGYKVYMRLKIRNLTQSDFGVFTCISKNSLGETDGSIKLYEVPAPSTTTVLTTRTTSMPRKSRKKDKYSLNNNEVLMENEWNEQGFIGGSNYDDSYRKTNRLGGGRIGDSSSAVSVVAGGNQKHITIINIFMTFFAYFFIQSLIEGSAEVAVVVAGTLNVTISQIFNNFMQSSLFHFLTSCQIVLPIIVSVSMCLTIPILIFCTNFLNHLTF